MMLALLGATWSARATIFSIAGSWYKSVLDSSVTASRTAAISSGSGGRGTYSLAPARIAETAESASVPTPHATTVVPKRSDANESTNALISSATSTMTRSAPWPARNAVSAASMSGTWATFAPRLMAILLAAPTCPSRAPIINNRMVVSC